ncbi:hypothetical protein N9H93_03950 [Rhizobiaceae bacterium]|nr:hypothetical protein [Rhizobiaceae bacterium]
MARPAEMHKHRGFPSRLPGTDHQFTIRRDNPKGAVKLVARPRYADRHPNDRVADLNFMACLVKHFGDEPFERGNLDAGRLSWLFGREVVAAPEAEHGPFDPASYEAMLVIDRAVAEKSYPDAFDPAQWMPDK